MAQDIPERECEAARKLVITVALTPLAALRPSARPKNRIVSTERQINQRRPCQIAGLSAALELARPDQVADPINVALCSRAYGFAEGSRQKQPMRRARLHMQLGEVQSVFVSLAVGH